MKDMVGEEAETEVNSPDKNFQLSGKRTGTSAGHLLPRGHSGEGTRLSVTEQQLYSRGIVREVLRTQQHKTVRHDIQRVHHEAALYAAPRPPIASELNFDSIPPSNKLYSSVCSAKIHRISAAIAGSKSATHTPHHSLAAGEQGGSGTATAQEGHPVGNGNISVSGLVTYKFNSVRAQRALVGQLDRDQLMHSQLSSIRGKRECSRARQKAILARSGRALRTENCVLGGAPASTECYLKQLRRSQEEGATIYKQRASKLRFIKELMREDALSYDDADHIVQKIEELQAEPPREPQQVARVGADEEEEIRRRRLSGRKQRVFIRYQTFVD